LLGAHLLNLRALLLDAAKVGDASDDRQRLLSVLAHLCSRI
jgi:hypothetical protein